jgi:uncharacterized protein YhaN
MSTRRKLEPMRIIRRRPRLLNIAADAPPIVPDPIPVGPSQPPRLVSRRISRRAPSTQEEIDLQRKIDAANKSIVEVKRHIEPDAPAIVKKTWVIKLHAEQDKLLTLRATKNKVRQENELNHQVKELISETHKRCSTALRSRTPSDIKHALQLLGELIVILESEKSPLLKKWSNVATMLADIQSMYEENISVNRLREQASSTDLNISRLKKEAAELEKEISTLQSTLQGKTAELKAIQQSVQQKVKEKGDLLEKLTAHQQQEVRVMKQKWSVLQKELSGIPFTRKASPKWV